VAVVAIVALVLVWLDRDRHRRGESALASRARSAEARLAVAEARLDQVAACRRELAALSGTSQFAGQAVSLLELPGTQLIPLERAQAVTTQLAANAIYHRGVKQAYVVIGGVPADHVGVEYEVWVVRGNVRELAGKAVPEAGGRALLTVPRPTLEPGVPAAFEVTDGAGNLLLASKMPI
jgi:hypothetical protein